VEHNVNLLEIEIIMIFPTSRAALATLKSQSVARAAAHAPLFVNPFGADFIKI